MNKAVFLDRDGVINPLVYNLMTGAYESPHMPEDFSLYPYVERALRRLKNAGFLFQTSQVLQKARPAWKTYRKSKKYFRIFRKSTAN